MLNLVLVGASASRHPPRRVLCPLPMATVSLVQWCGDRSRCMQEEGEGREKGEVVGCVVCCVCFAGGAACGLLFSAGSGSPSHACSQNTPVDAHCAMSQRSTAGSGGEREMGLRLAAACPSIGLAVVVVGSAVSARHFPGRSAAVCCCPAMSGVTIDPEAVVCRGAVLKGDVTIGPGCIVHPAVEINGEVCAASVRLRSAMHMRKGGSEISLRGIETSTV